MSRQSKWNLTAAVIFVTLLAVVAPWLYRSHVEREFSAFVRQRLGKESFAVRSSRCLGSPADGIRLLPVIWSRLTGSYPYEVDGGPRDRAYIQFAYYHGYWFNYCKEIRTAGAPEQNLIAFWSVRENRWHMGNFECTNDKMVWREFEPQENEGPNPGVQATRRPRS